MRKRALESSVEARITSICRTSFPVTFLPVQAIFHNRICDILHILYSLSSLNPTSEQDVFVPRILGYYHHHYSRPSYYNVVK